MRRASVVYSPDGPSPGIGIGRSPQPAPPPPPQPVSPGDSGSPIMTRKPPNDAVAEPAPSKIRAFAQALVSTHADEWNRKPHANRTGAMHVKSFHAKLTGESLEFLDKQINDWLDAHPEYEVKLVTSTVGDWTGKMREPNVIIQVWV